MINPPRTKEEAAKRRFRIGIVTGFQDPGCCSWECASGVQCYRKPGHGPANLYCAQHAKMIETRDQHDAAIKAAGGPHA